MKQVSATEAKNNFGAVLESSIEGPVLITRSGTLVAALLSADEYRNVQIEVAMSRAKRKLYDRNPQLLQVLRKFTSGDLSGRAATEQLELFNYGQLLDLLGLAGLPLPALPKERIEEMTAIIHGVLSDD